jgi:predicted dehydrogenase
LEIESLCADLKTVHPIRQRPNGEVQTFKGKEARSVATEPVKITTEDFGSIMLKFKNGTRGVVWVSQVTAGRKNCIRFEIGGSKATLAWNSEQPNTLWIGHREKANESLIRDPALVSDAARRYINYPGGHAEGFPDTFKQCFRAFYNYIKAGNFAVPEPFPTFADGHREILLCESILKSHKTRRWINIK